MGDLMLIQCAPDGVSAHFAQAHMGAAHCGQGPGKTPAIAVKHRQGPEIDCMFRDRRGNRIALGQ